MKKLLVVLLAITLASPILFACDRDELDETTNWRESIEGEYDDETTDKVEETLKAKKKERL